MKVEDIVKKLNLKVLSGKTFLEKEVTGGYCSDLLSDVMGNANEGNLWITLQVHKNIIAVASLKEVSGIILVKGLVPEKETLELSEKEEIPILSTQESAFDIAGKLFVHLDK
jgi:serine kinase of HPr protein (carbohydrate metabolism regulator)